MILVFSNVSLVDYCNFFYYNVLNLNLLYRISFLLKLLLTKKYTFNLQQKIVKTVPLINIYI